MQFVLLCLFGYQFLELYLLPASVMGIMFTQMQENFQSLTYNELYKT